MDFGVAEASDDQGISTFDERRLQDKRRGQCLRTRVKPLSGPQGAA